MMRAVGYFGDVGRRVEGLREWNNIGVMRHASSALWFRRIFHNDRTPYVYASRADRRWRDASASGLETIGKAAIQPPQERIAVFSSGMADVERFRHSSVKGLINLAEAVSSETHTRPRSVGHAVVAWH